MTKQHIARVVCTLFVFFAIAATAILDNDQLQILRLFPGVTGYLLAERIQTQNEVLFFSSPPIILLLAYLMHPSILSWSGVRPSTITQLKMQIIIGIMFVVVYFWTFFVQEGRTCRVCAHSSLYINLTFRMFGMFAAAVFLAIAVRAHQVLKNLKTQGRHHD